jgi:hypothetical protein
MFIWSRPICPFLEWKSLLLNEYRYHSKPPALIESFHDLLALLRRIWFGGGGGGLWVEGFYKMTQRRQPEPCHIVGILIIRLKLGHHLKLLYCIASSFEIHIVAEPHPLRLRVNILMRLRLLPYSIAKQNF